MKDFIDKILVSFTKLFNKKYFVTPSRRLRRRNHPIKSVKSVRKRRPVQKSPKKKLVARKTLPPKRAPKKKIIPKKAILRKKLAIVKNDKPEPKLAMVGEITHYFSKIQVIVLKITSGTLTVGETIHIKGKTTNFFQKVNSMQIESVDVKSARRGQVIGLKVLKEARPGDVVYKA